MPPKITPEYLKSQGLSEDFPERFWSKVDRRLTNDCWPWLAKIQHGGYGQIRTGINRKMITAPRAAYILTKGPIPNKLCVLHDCKPNNDWPRCCNPKHLWAVTNKQNSHDAIKKGTWHPLSNLHGEKNYNTHLTENDVMKIRQRYATGKISMKKLGAEYKVQAPCIHRIIHKHRWYHPKTTTEG